MFRNRGGFTILEVMIFLAISGTMLAAVMVVVRGQQSRTEFQQAMRDIDSKLQDTLNDVSTGNFTYNNKNCKVTGTAPVLSAGPTAIGTRSDCLFLGVAVQFSSTGTTSGVANNSRFFTYTVLGRRLKLDSLGNPVPVANFNEANPTAMISGDQDLSSSYKYGGGVTVSQINYTPISAGTVSHNYTLLGLYTSFNSAVGVGSSADASQSLQTFVYNLPDGTAFDSTGMGSPKKCVDDNNPGPVGSACPYELSLSTPGSTNGLSICFASNNGTGQAAMETLYNTAAGINTRLVYNPDTTVCPAG